MNNDPRDIKHGDRVNVFDARKFIDDITTPLSQTMRAGTVMRRYGKISTYPVLGCSVKYPDLIDVLFDGDKKVSKGYFTNAVEII